MIAFDLVFAGIGMYNINVSGVYRVWVPSVLQLPPPQITWMYSSTYYDNNTVAYIGGGA
jgi:hypothetical protein